MNPPIYTGSNIDVDLEEECREAMLHDSMDLPRLMVHVQQVGKKEGQESTLVQGKDPRQTKMNFSRKSSTEIRDKPWFKKGIPHLWESSSSKVRNDKDLEPRVKKNSEVDTP